MWTERYKNKNNTSNWKRFISILPRSAIHFLGQYYHKSKDFALHPSNLIAHTQISTAIFPIEVIHIVSPVRQTLQSSRNKITSCLCNLDGSGRGVRHHFASYVKVTCKGGPLIGSEIFNDTPQFHFDQVKDRTQNLTLSTDQWNGSS